MRGPRPRRRRAGVRGPSRSTVSARAGLISASSSPRDQRTVRSDPGSEVRDLGLHVGGQGLLGLDALASQRAELPGDGRIVQIEFDIVYAEPGHRLGEHRLVEVGRHRGARCRQACPGSRSRSRSSRARRRRTCRHPGRTRRAWRRPGRAASRRTRRPPPPAPGTGCPRPMPALVEHVAHQLQLVRAPSWPGG